MKLKNKRNYVGVLSSVFAIFIGLIVGLVVLILCNPSQAFPGFFTILTGAFTHGMKGVGQVFYYATPIILTGLSVGFAFKTGVFNIGTPGQFIMGAFGAVYAGIMWEQLGPVHWAAALLASIVMGALWGLIPGLLKAYFNVNVVIPPLTLEPGKILSRPIFGITAVAATFFDSFRRVLNKALLLLTLQFTRYMPI